jgi:glycine dehydrogenase subunit 2
MTHSQALSTHTTSTAKTSTFSGNKGVQIEEPLIFEINTDGLTGTDWQDTELANNKLGMPPRDKIGLPGLSESQVVRHYTRLSQKNYSIDTGIYPLGSCTMKHNPRLNEKVARMFGDIHPMQPPQTIQGALEVIFRLSEWLKKLTGMAAVAMSPAAGAQGEMCGIMAIKAALEARGENRHIILVPDSAHGTNPATAAACGFTVQEIKSTKDGRVDLDSLKSLLSKDVAGIMLTNPNTCGLFERNIVEIAKLVHEVGAYFYCDGANFNAIVGKVRPADLGIDCMHINLHKTFSTPHGGGGPGSGPVVFADSLAPYIPIPYVTFINGEYSLVESKDKTSMGRLKGFHGQMGMFTRALTYMTSYGSDGLRQVAEDAVLNANYVLAKLKGHFNLPYPAPCMHEVLFDDSKLKETGVSTLDFAKALIDEGFHPMTMYFPLVVSGAMLIEPTETESLSSIDQFINSMLKLAEAAKAGEKDRFTSAPTHAPINRMNETQAARAPILRYEWETI